MWQLVLLFVISFVFLLNGIIFVVRGLRYIVVFFQKKERESLSKGVKKSLRIFVVLFFAMVGLIFVSQFTAKTPKIEGERAVSELIEVELNGRKEWITIRGEDHSKPVLLFLAGGPGGTQIAAVRHELEGLEKEFVVVNWDQPGSGKSYGAIAKEKLKVEDYIADARALTDYLLVRFKQEKIYLVGESWGSALGIFLVKEYPEKYEAFVGTGQMVDFLQTEKIDYNLAKELAREKKDNKTLQKLQENGEPPYYGKDVTWKSAVYLQYLSSEMSHNPQIKKGGYQTFRDIGSEEYGLLDKIHYFRGIVTTFNHVYPQLYEIDLRQGYTDLEVPIYFFLGKHDINAPLSLAKEYFEKIKAPGKELVWFEHSGHSPWINENQKFIEEMVKVKEAHSMKHQ